MSPIEFIEWADDIAKGANRPAAMRSAISRAYYGAFHLAKEFLASIGVHPRKGENEHEFVQRHFKNCTHVDAIEAGGLLGNLHENRKDADYRLSKRHSETQQFAQDSVARAKLIQQKLASCAKPATLSVVKQEVEAYRKKINA